MFDIVKAVHSLPETAIVLFVEYAGSRSYHIGLEFASIAECLAAKVITKAMRLNLLKSKDSKQYPKIFKKYTLRRHVIRIGFEYVTRKLIVRHCYLLKVHLGSKGMLPGLDFSIGMANPILVDSFLETLKRNYYNIQFDNQSFVERASVRVALHQYKEFLYAASIEYLILHDIVCK